MDHPKGNPMDGNPPDASIILLTYNGELYLEEVLTSVFNQASQFSFEVIAIDSASSDRTLEIFRNYEVKLYQIPNHEFGHGKTRNLGVKLASGRYVVFLTQDATPAHKSWLENLVLPLAKDPAVAGTYSRQIPRPDCNPCEWRDIGIGAGPVSIVKSVNFADEFQKTTYEAHCRQFMLFSDVSSCIRKDVLERIPFTEKIAMVEDQEWCKRAIEAGYTVIYEATSGVYHSHNDSFPRMYKRQWDYGAAYSGFAPFQLSFKDILFYTIYEAFCDAVFIMRQSRCISWKLRWLLVAPLVRFTMRYGLYKGLQSPAASPG